MACPSESRSIREGPEELQKGKTYGTDSDRGRRTFAIISHPDAGKTTLTEKFLLYSGAIEMAGAVRSLSGDTQDSRLGIMAKTRLGRAVLADDPAGALDCFEEGLKEALALPWPLMVGQLLFEKARALDALGRRQEALAAAEEAVESREDLGAPEVGGVRDWISERRRKPPPDAGLTDGQ